MSPMIMGIIAAVVIVIIVGVLLARKKQGGQGGSLLGGGNRLKTLAEQQQELQAQANLSQDPTSVRSSQSTLAADGGQSSTQSSASSLSQPKEDVLKQAQHLFEQRDYAQVEQVLQPAIKREPYRSDLVLMLLNTYAVSKNSNAFNKLYPSIQQFDDHEVQAQAEQFKSLVDDEMLFSQAMQVDTTEPASPVNEGLDFDLDSIRVSQSDDNAGNKSPIPSSAPVAINTPSNLASPTTETELEDFDFDLALDSINPNAPSAAASISSQPATQVLANQDTDLALPTSLTDSSATDSATLDDTFELDDNLWQPENQDEITSTKQEKLLSSDNTELDLTDFGDLTLDMPSTPSVSPSQPAIAEASTKSDDQSFDFDELTFDMGESTTTETVNTPVVTAPPVDDVAQISDLDLTFDEPDSSPTPAERISTSESEEVKNETTEFDFSDLDLDVPSQIDGSSTSGTSETSSEPTTDWTELDLDMGAESLSAQTPTADQVDFAAVSTTAADNLNVDSAQATPATPRIASELSPVLSDALANVEHIDSEALTLELAEQYIELGEYDSAKRLLNEIAPHADPDAQAKIHTLLDKTY